MQAKKPKVFIFVEMAAFAAAVSSIAGVTPGWVLYGAIAVMVISFFIMFALLARKSMRELHAAGEQSGGQVSGLITTMAAEQTASFASSDTLPDPGYYPDPENPGMERWWNGQGWSDARRNMK